MKKSHEKAHIEFMVPLRSVGTKGQLNFPDFCPTLSGQKSGKILVGILGETMTS